MQGFIRHGFLCKTGFAVGDLLGMKLPVQQYPHRKHDGLQSYTKCCLFLHHITQLLLTYPISRAQDQTTTFSSLSWAAALFVISHTAMLVYLLRNFYSKTTTLDTNVPQSRDSRLLESFVTSRVKDHSHMKEIEEMIESSHFQLFRQRSSLAALRFCLKMELTTSNGTSDKQY